MRKILFALLLLSKNMAFAQSATENLKGIEEEIQSILTAYKAVGLSVAIVQNDKVIYSKGFGYRDYFYEVKNRVHFIQNQRELVHQVKKCESENSFIFFLQK